MPLVVLCGEPCTGKTRVARALFRHFSTKGRRVVLINEETLSISKTEALQDENSEQNARTSIKMAVDRNLDKETIVICDSLNYIRGYRYQLFCIARQLGTNSCVVRCQAPFEIACMRNEKRRHPLPEALFSDYWRRFEPPSSNNRWERPLFHLSLAEEDDGGSVSYLSVSSNAAPSAPKALRLRSIRTSVFLPPLDRISQQALQRLPPVPRASGAPQAQAQEQAQKHSAEPQDDDDLTEACALPDIEAFGSELIDAHVPPPHRTASLVPVASLALPGTLPTTHPVADKDVTVHESIPLDEISAALLNAPSLVPQRSTQKETFSDSTAIRAFAETSHALVSALVDLQRVCMPGDPLTLPNATRKLILPRPVGLGELRRLRRQFLRVAQNQQFDGKQTPEQLTDLFLSFLETQWRT